MRFVIALLAFAGCLQVACETRVSLGVPCRGDNECASGLRCHFGRCRTECESSSECPMGRFCLTVNATSGACTLPTDTCDEARLANCDDGLMCVGQTCVAPCSDATSCLAGTTCMRPQGVSVCLPPALLPDAGMDAAMSVLDTGLDAGRDVGVDTAPDVGVDASCGLHTHDGSVRTLCVGEHFACAVVAGAVRCWGSNDGAQLGDGTDVHAATNHPCDDESGYDCASTPVSVQTAAGPLRDATSVACGEGHACAITSAGAAVCWGYVRGTTYAQAQDMGVAGATAIFSGARHICVRVGTGYQCWGENQSNVGTYEMPDRRIDRRIGADGAEALMPLAATDFDGATLLETGGYFTCTTNAAGVDCQGWSEAAVCGNEPLFEDVDAGPVDGGIVRGHGIRPVVPEGGHITNDVAQDLHAGHLHACMLLDGRVSCWGGDQYGNLGNNSGEIVCDTTAYFCRPTPFAIDTTLRFSALSHGASAVTCGIERDTREVYCWGQNNLGQSGAPIDPMHNGVALSMPVPRSDGSALADVVEVAVGPSHSCARTACGAVYCWGGNGAAQLGRGTTGMADARAAQVTDL